jgi:CRISPR-associated endonuclease/helicase Cas3
MSDVLYAKSQVGGKVVTLVEHSKAVLDTARCIYGNESPTKLGLSWLKFFGLTEENFKTFIINLSLAAIFHDIGKANNGFQLAISRKGEQVIRHEHLSALILWLPEIWKWLGTSSYIKREIVLAAVLCHHLKVNDSDHFLHNLTPADGFSLYCCHADFTRVLQLAEPIIGQPPPDLSSYEERWTLDNINRKSLRDHLYVHVTKTHRKDIATRNLYLAVKAGLIAADASGSALVREGIELEEWIRKSTQQPVLTANDVDRLVIAPRMRQIEERTGKPFVPRTFQNEAGNLGPRALLLAGCGAGKTLAAWKWVQNQAETHRFSRVLFLYPTRATATEGFRDYVSWAGSDESALLHGTSEYDLTGMFINPADSRAGQDYTAQQGLYALGYWPKRIFSATVDSFLSFMAHGYTSLCMLPLLADAAVVIDEVHSFDRSMFIALEQFLKAFPSVPVLCMTASLTADRQQILTDGCGLELFPKGAIDDLMAQAGAPRYLIRLAEEKPDSVAREALLEGKKVLWVVNTVDRCQATHDTHAAFYAAQNIPIICYHSRFRLKDRKAHHEEVIRLFREHAGAALVVSTQVCEMSLDLDADVLVTEMAPVPSLIQRMGRCCRVEKPGDRRGIVYVCPPADEKPYTKDELAQCRDFVRHLSVKMEVSQDDLSAYLAEMDVCKPHIEGGFTGFLDSGWYAMGSEESFRDETDFTIDCILDSDIEEFTQLKRDAPERATGLVVPVPKRFANREHLVAGRFPVAPSDHYNHLVGFSKQEGAYV